MKLLEIFDNSEKEKLADVCAEAKQEVQDGYLNGYEMAIRRSERSFHKTTMRNVTQENNPSA